MANKLTKSNIVNGADILAGHVTQSVDAWTGVPYDLTQAGTLNLTGSIVTGSISHAITASHALNGGGGSVGTLQDVTTLGNTTDKNISTPKLIAPIIREEEITLTVSSATGSIKFEGPSGVKVTIDHPSGNITSSGIVSMTTASIGGGLFTSASLAAGGDGTTVIGNPGGTGANLTTINIGGTTYEVSGSSGNAFPFTGSAGISGSLETVGVEASHLDGQFDVTSSIVVTVASKTANHRYDGQGSGNGYYLNTIESPYIDFYPGKVYKFDQSDSSNAGGGGHPIIFYLDAARNTEYNTGVIYYADGIRSTAADYNANFNTATDRYTQITVTENTPSILYYQCYNHGYMGNAAYLQGGTTIVANPGSSGGGGLTTIGIGGTNYSIAEGGGPIETHTSNFTSSAAFNGKYNIVGGNLAIAVDTSSGDLAAAMEWNFFQTSSGDNFEFVPKTGVTLISKNSHKKLAEQGSAATLKYISGQTFHLVGDLTL